MGDFTKVQISNGMSSVNCCFEMYIPVVLRCLNEFFFQIEILFLITGNVTKLFLVAKKEDKYIFFFQSSLSLK